MKKICAIDTETTGLQPGVHEVIQFAAIPLTDTFEIDSACVPLNIRIKAHTPEKADSDAMALSGLDLQDGLNPDAAGKALSDWLTSSGIEMIIPLGHNLKFDLEFLTRSSWVDSKIFHYRFHDSLLAARLVNDVWRVAGRGSRFESFKLGDLAKNLNLCPSMANGLHDADYDARLSAAVYRSLMLEMASSLTEKKVA